MIKKLRINETLASEVDNEYYLFEVLNDMGFAVSHTNNDVTKFIEALASNDYYAIDIACKATRNVYRLCTKPNEPVFAVSFHTEIKETNNQLLDEISKIENILSAVNSMNF
jgi:threonine synthase